MTNIVVIDSNNRELALGIKIKPNQYGYCETSAECLREADDCDCWYPVLIETGGEAAGFAMYGFFPHEGEYGRAWLDRFFIDENHQGKGYGRMGVIMLIQRICREFNVNEVYLSVYADNSRAIKLYRQLGFKYNGEKDLNGEDVMIVQLKELKI